MPAPAHGASGPSRPFAPALQVARLGLPDGAVAAHADALEAALRERLRPSDLVVSTWRLDGHPDHDATGRAAARVCAELGCRLLEAPVWMWHWAAPGDARVPWHRLRRLALAPPQAQRKREALAAHATQLADRGGDRGPVLGTAILDRLQRTHEYFFVP